MIIRNYCKKINGFSREVKILACSTFINRAGAMVVPFLSKYMFEELHFSYGQIGWVMVCLGFGSLIGTWISGKLSDRLGYYKVMVFSLLCSGIVFIILGFLSTFYSFCTGVLLLTVISDMYRPAMLLSLSSYSRREERTQALALIRSSINLGYIFSPLLGGLLISLLNYKYLFVVDGSTCIISALLFLFLVKEKKLPYRLRHFNNLKEKITIFQDRPFIFHLVVTMLTGFLFFQIFTTLPLYYKEIFNFSSFQSGLFLGLSGLMVFLFELPIVQYAESKNISKLHLIASGIFLMAVSYLLLLIENCIISLVAMIVLMTVGVMLTFPFANSFAKKRALKKIEGRFMAAFSMSYSIAQMLSTKIGMEITANYGFRANWLVLSCIGISGSFLCCSLNVFVKKEEEEIRCKIIKSIFSIPNK